MDDQSGVLKEWKERLSHSHRAHKFVAAHYEAWGKRLGIIATVSSAIVGTTIFGGSLFNILSTHINLK